MMATGLPSCMTSSLANAGVILTAMSALVAGVAAVLGAELQAASSATAAMAVMLLSRNVGRVFMNGFLQNSMVGCAGFYLTVVRPSISQSCMPPRYHLIF